METKSKKIIRNRFKGFRFKKIICYKNPAECSHLKIERVNPDHVGIVWGKRKRGSKGRNYVKVGKVFYEMMPLVFGLSVVGWLDAFTGYVFGLLVSVGLLSLVVGVLCGLILYFPFLHRRALVG